MKILTTIEELMEKGVWARYCELRGLNPYCVAEGLVDKGNQAILSLEEAHQINLLDMGKGDGA